MTILLAPGKLPLENDFDLRWKLTETEIGSGIEGPAESLTVVAFIAETNAYNATAIHADLQVNLTERTPGVDGDYYGRITGDKITLRLASYLGKKVYEIVKVGTAIRRFKEWTVVTALEADNA